MRGITVFLAIVLAGCGVAFAQAPGRSYTIGVLTPGHDGGLVVAHLVPELARIGFVEGQNLKVEWRFAGGVERLTSLANELVAARVDLIIGVSSVAIQSAKRATQNIPVVMASATEDPIVDDLIRSFAEPGGNITGVAMLGTEGDLKRIELLREAMPDAKRLAYLISPGRDPVQEKAQQFAREAQFELEIVKASARAEYDAVFSRLAEVRPSALAVGSFPAFATSGAELAIRANALRIPTMCAWREMAVAGCTMSFGPSSRRIAQRVGWYVAEILNGQSPARLPVEQPERFELVLNLQMARALGIPFPATFLARADEVIE